MSNDGSSKSGASFGPVLTTIAAFFLYFSRDIPPHGLAESDPGPRAWPVLLASCLLLAGIGYTVAWGVTAYRTRHDRSKLPPKRPPTAYLTDWGLHNVLLIVAGLVLFLVVLPYLGFVITAALFCTAVMTRLGHPAVADALDRRRDQGEAAMWKSLLLTGVIATVVSVVLITIVVVLFDRVFNSPLPKSETFNLPF